MIRMTTETRLYKYLYSDEECGIISSIICILTGVVKWALQQSRFVISCRNAPLQVDDGMFKWCMHYYWQLQIIFWVKYKYKRNILSSTKSVGCISCALITH